MNEPMNELMRVEAAAARYRAARDTLRDVASTANMALEDVKRVFLPEIRQAMHAVSDCESALREAVEASPPELWRKSRTRVLHGVKVGWTKQRGRVEFDDEAKVIERIRKLLPREQAELLIRVREAVHKPAVYDLTAGDLKRLGITISADCDAVLVKDLASELDRAIEALLDQAARAEGVAP